MGNTMKRRGRKRKSGARHPGGKLRQPIRVSPREVAAAMPHRRGLKEPVDPLAESEIGRMCLRGEIEREQLLAGQEYARLWRLFLATVGGPRALVASDGHGTIIDCGGCLGMVATSMCICARRRNDYWRARLVAGPDAPWVSAVAIDNHPVPRSFVDRLHVGLWALAQHFGLTRGTNRRIAEMHRPNHVLVPPAEPPDQVSGG